MNKIEKYYAVEKIIAIPSFDCLKVPLKNFEKFVSLWPKKSTKGNYNSIEKLFIDYETIDNFLQY